MGGGVITELVRGYNKGTTLAWVGDASRVNADLLYIVITSYSYR